MHTESATAAELRHLVSRLEQSGLVGQRADVAALLDRSRTALALAAAGRSLGASAALPAGPRPRRHGRARPTAKLRALGLLLIDLAFSLLGGAAALGLAGDRVAAGFAVPTLAAASLWGMWRWGDAPACLGEIGFRLLYVGRWAWLWVAEAFSNAASDRLEVLLAAREVMAGWKAWRRALPRNPRIEDVAAYLAESHGPLAAQRFGVAIAARGGSLRWSRLIRAFEDLAREEALWPQPAPTPPVPSQPAATVEAPLDPEAAERARRCGTLSEAIRQKRAEIRRVDEWKMKTPSEIAYRDAHVAQLWNELAALQAELGGLQ